MSIHFRGSADRQQINQLQDKLAAAQLDLDSRDQEIEDLNRELDGKVREHEKELGMVADEWRDEVGEARAQVEELKDVSHPLESDEDRTATRIKHMRVKEGERKRRHS